MSSNIGKVPISCKTWSHQRNGGHVYFNIFRPNHSTVCGGDTMTCMCWFTKKGQTAGVTKQIRQQLEIVNRWPFESGHLLQTDCGKREWQQRMLEERPPLQLIQHFVQFIIQCMMPNITHGNHPGTKCCSEWRNIHAGNKQRMFLVRTTSGGPSSKLFWNAVV